MCLRTKLLLISAVIFITNISLPTGTAIAQESSVVRSKLFSKSKRLEITPFVGYVSNDPWTTGIIPGAAVTYHLSETTALDFTAGYGIYQNKDLYDQVDLQTGKPPRLVSRPLFFVTANYAWAPIYGKLNLLGELALHYDMFLVVGGGISGDEIELNKESGGVATQETSMQIFPVIDFGLGQRYFFSNNLALRIDIRPYVFMEFIDNQVDPNADVQVTFGLSYLL